MEKTDYSIGHLRIKYLDLANNYFAQQQYIIANGFIDDFIGTIDEKSTSGIDIKLEFDNLNRIKKERLQTLKETAEKLGYLEKKDFENNERENIEINNIHDKKAICWRISMRDGLFND